MYMEKKSKKKYFAFSKIFSLFIQWAPYIQWLYTLLWGKGYVVVTEKGESGWGKKKQKDYFLVNESRARETGVQSLV